MNFIVWMLFGAIAGWIASIIAKTNSSQGTLGDIVLGIIGAMVGGFVFNIFGATGVSGFNFYSFLVAVVGSLIVIWLGRIISGHTT